MAHNQVILSDSGSTIQMSKTIQDVVDKAVHSPVTDCNMCCTKALHTSTTNTTTEALVNSSLHHHHQTLAHIHNNGSLDRPVGSEPQTLQQAVVELVEIEEKKVFPKEYFTLANTSEPMQIHNHFNHSHHHTNITTATTTTAAATNNMKRAPVKSNRHANIGERPFGCHICGFAFSRNDHLVRHVNSHHKAKNFKCDICGKALSRRDHLKVHLRIHSGERPYKCTICGFAFSRHDHLVKHNQPNKGRRKLSCVPQPGLKIEPEADLPMVTTPVAVTTESGEIVIAQAQIQAQPQQLPQQQQQHQHQHLQTQQAVSHVDVLNQHLVTTAAPTTATTAVDNIVTPTTVSLHNTNTNGTIEILAQPQQQLYQTISTAGGANTVQVYPVTQLFPTTFQVSPTTAQIFPTTIQMNATTAQIIPLQMYPITTQIAAAPVYPKQ